MMTSPVTPEDLGRSVIALPPLARRPDLTLDEAENARILAHLRAGGVTSFLYGTSANLFHVGVSEFGTLLEMLLRIADENDLVIPSIGADFGKALDQAAIVRTFDFPTVAVLPQRFAVVPKGVATGLRRIADACGRPIVVHVAAPGYIEAADLGRLARDGAVAAVKYAIARKEPAEDSFLADLLGFLDPSLVISGNGERSAGVHRRAFGMRSFTSGAACIAPALSSRLLAELSAGADAEADRTRERFLSFEDLRDAHSPVRVLHDAVRLAGIADTGPLLPMLANLDDEGVVAAVAEAARRLLVDDEWAREQG